MKYIKFRPWNKIDQSEFIETYKELKQNPHLFALDDDFAKLQSQMSNAVNEVCPEKKF